MNRLAQIVDLPRLLNICKTESNKLGFIPWPRFGDDIRKGRIIVACEDDNIIGYLMHGPIKHVTFIHQCVVIESCRRFGVGTSLVEALEAKLPFRGVLRLGCREELEANQFWQYLGFKKETSRPGGRARGFQINIYSN